MSHCSEDALRLAHEQSNQTLNTLKEFVRIPSISTDPAARPSMSQAAEWVSEQMGEIGLNHIAVFPTEGHPVVYGDCCWPAR